MSVEIEGEPRLSLIAGQAYNLTCRVFGGRPAPGVSWQRDGQAMNANTNETRESATDSRLQDTVARLTVVPDLDDHDQVYRCQATHPALTAAIATQVTINVMCTLYSSPSGNTYNT